MPSPVPDRTAYEILDISRAAPLEDIKKRYRELARKHHPDVNASDPAAAQRFSEISLAYRTLSDTESRRALDAEISLREQRAQAAAERARAANAGNTRAYNARPAGPAPNAAARPAAASTPGSPAAEAARLTVEGRNAYLRDRPAEARNLAEQALRHNRRNAEAWELLGDVFRRQGRTEEAINAYSMCLQINPRNSNVMSRLERMARASGPSASRGYYDSRGGSGGAAYNPSVSGGAGYGRPAGNVRPAAAGRASRLSEDKRPWGRLLAGVVGYGAVILTILWVGIDMGNPPRPLFPIGAVSHWNANIIIAMGLVGLLLGATMTITGAIRRIDDELVFTGVTQRGGPFLPLGLLMIVGSVLSFYFAAVCYAIVSLFQESFTPSMMRVFAAVTISTGLLALDYSIDHVQVMLLGSNVVFITFVVGWLLGDFFRADVL